MVVVNSQHFGRMGDASVRYCRRNGMKYQVGLQFSVVFGLSDPARKNILDELLGKESGSAH